MVYPKSPLECIQDAWIALLADFRAWLKPETSLSNDWKNRPFTQAVGGCRSLMMDDAEAMLTAWRKNQVEGVDIGLAAPIPTMLTANAVVQQPPDVSELRGTPYWLDGAVMKDGVLVPVQVRTIPKAVRIQTVYFTTNPHDAASVMDQFCAYMTDDAKRRFLVHHDLGGGVIDSWQATILDNNLFPDSVTSDAKNISIVSVDVTVQTVVPHVIGLAGEWDATTDNGHDDGGDMGGGNGGQDQNLGKVVIQADDTTDGRHTRINADPVTGKITVVTP